ncbi:hypothetical protein DM48_372 [Burkholderia gladioli]|uniref:Uncharacterized protein n=1 Tax=Burkholderia gladioli TaxID=28095 RepID=A0AAW3EXR9_BURGA|nr:hypothetical protein [Burkholderia gladioli]KGC12896.1 hypothetical protein DM48_372 [Burkholderia gladioli]
MPSIAESLGTQSQLASTLAAGVDQISQSQEITFTRYSQSVLASDGYVFWVNTGQTQTVKGSLHQVTDQQQNEDETIDINRIIFTALDPIDDFNTVAPTDLFIGEIDGIKFSFNARGSLYRQANLYHYVGNAVYPALASQLIDSAADLPAGPIVSNSLPIWLAQSTPQLPIYPSYLVPANVVPPYVVAHIEPDATEAPSFPDYVWPGTVVPNSGGSPLHNLPSSQLAKDRVRLTMYGLNNQQAIQFYASLIDYSLNTDNFGFGNSPAIKDAKRTQSELNVIAMKKTLDIDAWYFQTTSDAIARRLILEAGFSSITTS